MANHRAPRHGVGRTRVVLAAFAALIAVVASPGVADAAAGKTARTSNPNVVAKCNMSVTAVNVVNGTETLKVSAQAQPATLAGYANNVHTQVYCAVFSPSNTLLGDLYVEKNGAIVATTSTTMVIPVQSSLQLCVTAGVTLKNGNFTTAPTVCV